MQVAPGLAANCANSPERAEWLGRLPELLGELQHRWSLTIHDRCDSDEATCSYIVRAARKDGTPAVLKLAMPHFEGDHEIQGLLFWNGDATVHVLDYDIAAGAMLLERCDPGTVLRTLSEPEQDVVIAQLLRRLWRLPRGPHPFRTLSELMRHWAAEAIAGRDRWIEPSLVEDALRLFRELPESAPRNVLLTTDLHAGNVLRARREPWLVIDPKPFIGDPAFDLTQHLFNCRERLIADPAGTIRRLADLAEVDEGRVRLWTFARAAVDSSDRQASLKKLIARTLARI